MAWATEEGASIESPRGLAAPRGSDRLPYLYRVPYCVPYWQRATLAAIARCWARNQLGRGPDGAVLARRLERRLATAGAIGCASGRVALHLALRALGVGVGDEVVLPSFCCASVVEAIRAAGANPVLSDVDSTLTVTTETIEPCLGARTRAVVVPSLFGNPAPLPSIAALCRPRGIAVIDDAAQALGATLEGKPLGTFGDAGVISFGAGKVCFGSGGGVLCANSEPVAARAAEIPLATQPALAAGGRPLRVLLWRRWRRWSLPLARVMSRLGLPPVQRPVQHAERLERMSNVDAAVAVTLVDTLDANLTARRQRVAAYVEQLGTTPRLILLPHAAGSACLTQVVHLDIAPAQVSALRARLHAAGYEIDGSYRPLHLTSNYASGARDPLPETERLWERLLELPCEPSVPLTAVEQIAATIQQSLAQLDRSFRTAS